MRAARTILEGVVGWVVLGACIGFLLVVGIGPRVFHYRTLTVLTGSMSPGMPPGSVEVVTRERPEDLRVGQVIVYNIPVDDHRVVSHRVVSITDPGAHPVVQTKGDANDGRDPWVARVDAPTVWKVSAVVPRLGWAIIWLRKPMVHRVTVFAVPFLLALIWLRWIWGGRPEPLAIGVG